jgi:hypothetical protein
MGSSSQVVPPALRGHFVSWIVGIATEPERRYVLVLGSSGPMAYVILAADESELLDVIRAIRVAILRAN